MRIAHLSKALVAIAALAVYGAAYSSNACQASICSSEEECRNKAQWEIEGTVFDLIRDKPGKGCMGAPLPELQCGQTDPHPLYFLEGVEIKKGKFDVSASGRTVISRYGICFYRSPSVYEPLKRSERYRFFGIGDYGFVFVSKP